MKPRRAALAALMLVPRMALGAQAPKSQHAMVTQLVGTAQVTIVYNRPSARGRTLFGGEWFRGARCGVPAPTRPPRSP